MPREILNSLTDPKNAIQSLKKVVKVYTAQNIPDYKKIGEVVKIIKLKTAKLRVKN